MGKSQINFDDFDLLYYAKSDIENAIIPFQVKIIKRRSFQNHNKLKTVTFPEDSQLKSIEDFAFASSSINKIKLPASIENISFNCFSSVKNLNEIEIFSKSKTFSIIDKKYLVKKSRGSSEFDILIFARRDIENASIPSQIKVINDYAFQYCKKLKSITFDEDSSLEMINSYAFYQISGPEKIVFPPLLKELGNSSFGGAKNIKVIEFLGDFVRTNSYCFASCSNLSSISFLNASHVTIEGSSFTGIPKNAKINVGRLATLDGSGIIQCKNNINYINTGETVKWKIKAEDNIKMNRAEKVLKKQIQKLQQEKKDYQKYVSYLQHHLHKYEEFIPFEQFVKDEKTKDDSIEDDQNDDENEEILGNENVFIGSDDEVFHKIESKIWNGKTSDLYKVIDERNGQVMCKKIVKECSADINFINIKNSLKEINVCLDLKHPCICEAIGYNMQEEIVQSSEVKDDDENEKTTVAIFFEYLPFSLKNVIDKSMMSNTLKVRIAIEIAFGMSYIHSHGLIHRDLSLDNIMLNSVFNSKIIDFGDVYLPGFTDSDESLEKDVNKRAYMSPEILNDEKYDNKTDVFSYGILLFVLFTGELPKVPLKFPIESPMITEYCIDLIKRCILTEASERPTFDEIIDDMANNSFLLAAEIDTKAVICRYRELNCFKKQHQK